MKKLTISLLMAGMAVAILGACGAPTQRGATSEQENETALGRLEKGAPVIVYSSAVAAGKPAFADDDCEGPLKMVDGRKLNPQPFGGQDLVEIADIGGYELNGERQRLLNLIYFGSDTLRVDSVLLPDARFKAEWQREEYWPGMLSGMVLYGESEELIEDYRVVVVFKNEGIAPQTLHINIHPDVHKLHADYAARGQE